MITCDSQEADFEVTFTNGRHIAVCDAPAAKGGGDAGFRPLELLEAALGGCINIWLRMYAADHQIPLAAIRTRVSLNREIPGEAVFEYGIELRGPLSESQRRELIRAAESCPVHQSLSRRISFQPRSRSGLD